MARSWDEVATTLVVERGDALSRYAYLLTGSVDDAANFVPALGHVDGRIRWAGEDLYHRPGPVAR